MWRWQFRFRGKYQQMSLRSYPEVTLQEARLLHQAQEKILHRGLNPMEVRKEGKRASKAFLRANSTVKSFAEVEKEWFEHWKAGKDCEYARQMEGRIETDILPCFVGKSIDEIEAPDVAAMARANQAPLESMNHRHVVN